MARENLPALRFLRHLRSLVCLVVAALLAATVAHATSVGYEVDPTPVGAVLEFPEGCRGDAYEGVHAFIAEYAPLYAAVTIARRERMDGARFVLYNAQQQPVDSFSVAPLYAEEMVEQLGARGVHFWTPAPEYRRAIAPTERCRAWRQTASCDVSADAVREPAGDEHCSVVLGRDRSGFCECADGRRVALACGRADFVTCESQC